MKTPEEIATQTCIENGWPVRTAGALTEGYCMARNAACLAQRDLAQKVKELLDASELYISDFEAECAANRGAMEKKRELDALLAGLTKEDGK